MPAQLLRFTPRPSLLLIVFLVTIHAGAGLSLISLTITAWLKLAMAAGVVVSFFRLGAIHGWRTSPHCVVELSVNDDGRMTWVYNDGVCWEGRLLQDTYIHPQAVILRVTSQGDIRSVALLRGQLGAEPFHRLRTSVLQILRDTCADEL